jgi:hypothetical protein
MSRQQVHMNKIREIFRKLSNAEMITLNVLVSELSKEEQY